MFDERTDRRAVLVAVAALVAAGAGAAGVAQPGGVAGTDDESVAPGPDGGLAGEPDGSAATATAYDPNASTMVAVTSDADGDGRPDVVALRRSPGGGVYLVFLEEWDVGGSSSDSTTAAPADRTPSPTASATPTLTATATPTPPATPTPTATPTDEPIGPVEITGGCLGGDGVIYVFGDATREDPILVTIATDDGEELGTIRLTSEADSDEATGLANGTYTVDAETASGASVPVTRSSVTVSCGGV